MGYILSLISAVVTSVVVSLINENRKLRAERKANKSEKVKANDELLLGLARITLMQSTEKALDRGNTTTDEYDVINQLYTAYAQMGGNGTVKHLFERYETLKVY